VPLATEGNKHDRRAAVFERLDKMMATFDGCAHYALHLPYLPTLQQAPPVIIGEKIGDKKSKKNLSGFQKLDKK
jgi:hypothetical protein